MLHPFRRYWRKCGASKCPNSNLESKVSSIVCASSLEIPTASLEEKLWKITQNRRKPAIKIIPISKNFTLLSQRVNTHNMGRERVLITLPKVYKSRLKIDQWQRKCCDFFTLLFLRFSEWIVNFGYFRVWKLSQLSSIYRVSEIFVRKVYWFHLKL